MFCIHFWKSNKKKPGFGFCFAVCGTNRSLMFKRLVTRTKFLRPLLNWGKRCDCILTKIKMKTKPFSKMCSNFFCEDNYFLEFWFASTVNYSSSRIQNLAFYFFWSNFQLLIRQEQARLWLLPFTLERTYRQICGLKTKIILRIFANSWC